MTEFTFPSDPSFPFRLLPAGNIEKFSQKTLSWVPFKVSIRPDGRPITTSNRKTFYMSRVVWQLNRGPIPNGFRVVPLDGNVGNYDLSNLRLVAHRDVQRTGPTPDDDMPAEYFPFRHDDEGRLRTFSYKKDAWILANDPIGEPPFVTYEKPSGKRAAMYVSNIEEALERMGKVSCPRNKGY